MSSLINQQIDDHVMQKNARALDTLYAEDLVFSHGSGRIEGKAGWMKTVGRNNYPLRKHDSVSGNASGCCNCKRKDGHSKNRQRQNR